MLSTLIYLLILLSPTQLSYTPDFINVNVLGFRIDYLIPTIYLTDILILIIIYFSKKKITSIFESKDNLIILISLSFFIIINILISEIRVASIYKWFKFIEMFVLGLIIFKLSSQELLKLVVKPLVYSIIGVSLIGITQQVNGGPLGGLFYFLGERQFNLNDPNIAPYPYSTFSHPNSFAGFIFVGSLLVYKFKKYLNKKTLYVMIILVFTSLILSRSQNVYIAFFCLYLIRSLNLIKKRVYLASFFVSNSFLERINLLEVSKDIIKDNFVLGVGLNNFIKALPKYTSNIGNLWQIQPVHNIFTLIVSEVGLMGFLTLFLVITYSSWLFNYPLIAIFLTGLNDHYWLTLQQNMILLTIVLVYSLKKSTIKK